MKVQAYNTIYAMLQPQRTALVWASLLLLSSLNQFNACSAQNASILQFHKNPSKDGFYVDFDLQDLQPARTSVANGFSPPRLSGQSYAQLLYFDRGNLSEDIIVSSTQANVVTAVLAGNGTILWRRQLADAVPSEALPCGNISPLVGILSTPIIDVATGTVVLSAKTTADQGTTQAFHSEDSL